MAAIETLEMFKQYTRAQYEAEFGVQPPPFDVTRPDKLWFDTSETAGNYTRISRDAAGKPSIVPMTMSRELAASVNIPGAYRYPRYVVVPTLAEVVLPANDGSVVRLPIDPGQLASEAEARALAAAIGGIFEIDASWYASSAEWKGESRRLYNIVLGDERANAGQLLQAQAVNGVGAPGKWVGLRWEPAAQPTAQLDPQVQPIPVPCRPLSADEEFRQGFGGTWTVEKKTPASDESEALRLLRLICQTFRIAF